MRLLEVQRESDHALSFVLEAEERNSLPVPLPASRWSSISRLRAMPRRKLPGGIRTRQTSTYVSKRQKQAAHDSEDQVLLSLVLD